ncbi:MAG: transposase family protein [Gammaproteobacteria bacterium]|nr:transposase family protein [Gammaproteobacteria bacterium]
MSALEHGEPVIFNTDQGSQFTSKEFTQVLLDRQILISMDGRGRALDNVFIERLWRSVKYENIYLNDYQSVPELYKGLNGKLRPLGIPAMVPQELSATGEGIICEAQFQAGWVLQLLRHPRELRQFAELLSSSEADSFQGVKSS